MPTYFVPSGLQSQPKNVVLFEQVGGRSKNTLKLAVSPHEPSERNLPQAWCGTEIVRQTLQMFQAFPAQSLAVSNSTAQSVRIGVHGQAQQMLLHRTKPSTSA